MEKSFKIIIPSVGRSDYNILRNLILESQKNNKYNSHVLSIGSHNSKLFGDTKNLFKRDKIKKKSFIKIKYFKNDKNNTIIYFSKIIKEIDKILKKIKPNICIIMGDRYEMFASAIACKNLNIKIIHLCGGSTTLGSHDNDYRYCISKLSDFHFVETYQHKKKLINNDIKKDKILVSGAPALENLDHLIYKNKNILFEELNIPATNQKIIVFTYHPETTETLNTNAYPNEDIFGAQIGFGQRNGNMKYELSYSNFEEINISSAGGANSVSADADVLQFRLSYGF